MTQDENTYLKAARAGDQEAFAQLIDPYRKQILVHCYRILGSFEDAEDMLQETLVRVWKRLDSFEGRSSLRTWLYKVATNACLDALDSRRVRGLAKELYPRGDPTRELPPPSTEVTWVEPFPDEYIDGQPNMYPEARYEVRESITLAFVAALQKLPGRQRAASAVRCPWVGREGSGGDPRYHNRRGQQCIAACRETMKQGERKTTPSRLNEQLSALLARYVNAWEAADSAALVAVLREDVALTMPPVPVWFGGRVDVQTFLEGGLFKMFDPFRVRLIPVRFNGSPAFAVYQMDAQGTYRAAALHILTIENGAISEINDFLTFDGQLFSKFGLPLMVLTDESGGVLPST